MTENSGPAISVVLPVFNGQGFLAEQLGSILNQSWRDFELLIQDDGSSDRSMEIAAHFAQADKRVQLLPQRSNEGQKLRLRELVSASQSPLIAISDQDDIWHAQKLERLISKLGNAALAFGRSELIDENGRTLGRTLLDANGTSYQPGDRLSLLFRPRVSGHSLIARREVCSESVFGSNEPYDWLLSLNAEFSRGLAYDDSAIVYHRLHGANSYNDAVLARIRPWHVRPLHLRKALNWVGGRRTRFVTGLKFLSRSENVPANARSTFRQVADMCDEAWSFSGHSERPTAWQLQTFVIQALEPFAGSRRDWRMTMRWVRFLSFCPWLGRV